MEKRNKQLMMLGAAVTLGIATVAGATTASNLPPEQKQGAIAFLSGGIGVEQRTAMKDAARNYPLELEFVKGTKAPREYLAGVHVDIKDSADHTVLSTLADGPLLLASLPGGRYSISVTNAGSTEARTVMVEQGKHQRVLFDWK
jgi:hypothetical protein